MPPLTCTRLPPIQRRLLEQFYRQHGSRMRAAGDGEQWVARSGEIIGGMNLSPVEDGSWLTGLFVAPQWRGQQVASQLLQTALGAATTPTWLFCHPDLTPFYQRLAFTSATTLPKALASRLARYQRSKPLVALVRDQSSATSSPGNSTSV
ncbi:GNAT family N-acetyltransferase [Pseudomonas mosselii]|uniref:GNAT family N-acetyltransferase n=1 Tax=Pseudomonas mosselii TaxID=78327 RepID=UPI002447ACDA|nr:GNAT family N-acetyltransferase [Pseudomonas mosselii]MDH0626758.1 GNAT family N-acetyltransferase [Pseudomonas mosselii]MDH0677420.1 GNAT family N-acetyltransferase [Pseudomonas mosselii]MDH0923621.1 GNAT family N-acetyltransferase [Pseudomonas mosselii]MDH1133774.1 GNAT family N-acetyltransferase [Pseudomonas mosselii]MDH1140826.1 GNAT family N-acetyltransferase [Pseudomonas mosselii]